MSCLEEYLKGSSGSDIPSEGITTASFLDKNSKEEIKFYKVKNNNKTVLSLKICQKLDLAQKFWQKSNQKK